MSEEIKKSAEEVLADVVKSEVASVDAKIEDVKKSIDAIEIPSTEGFAKEEAIAEINEKLEAAVAKNEELEAIIKAAPAISEEKSEMENEGKIIFNKGFVHKFNSNDEVIEKATGAHFEADFTKAFPGTGSTAQVTGSRTDMQRLYHQMQQRNPFRMISTIMPTSAGSVNLPEVTSISAAVENTVPNNAPTGTPGGNVASVNVLPQNWVSRNQFSDQAVEDLPGLDSMIASFMAQAIARAEAADMVSQLDGNAGVAEVNTGVAANLPTSIGPWTDLMAALDSAYRDSAMWVMSRNAYAHLRQTTQGGTGSDLLFDPATGKPTFLGYPILINDHLDDGTTAGDNAVYFGDFAAGTVIVSRKSMNISRHEDTVPGAMYYYGNMRSRGVVWDANAIVRFNTAV